MGLKEDYRGPSRDYVGFKGTPTHKLRIQFESWDSRRVLNLGSGCRQILGIKKWVVCIMFRDYIGMVISLSHSSEL